MTRHLKRIAPVQAGKVLGILYAAMSLLLVPIFLVMALVGAFAQPNQSNGGFGAVAAGFMIGMALLLPVMYGVVGFIFGVISAAVYNLIAKRVGGFEFEIEDLTPVQNTGGANPTL
jgi:hypothetical protein